MVRHPDGEISWTRHEHSNGHIVYLPRRTPTYDDIFKRFESD
jgi:hypothetical protein